MGKESGNSEVSTTTTTTAATTTSTAPNTAEKQEATLSPVQRRIRERILKQKLLSQKQLKQIISGSGKTDKKQSQSQSKTSTSNSFPSRINLMDVKLRGNQFSFATLPI